MRLCKSLFPVLEPGVLSPLRRPDRSATGEALCCVLLVGLPLLGSVPEPGIEPTPPALEGGFLATGSPQKSLGGFRRSPTRQTHGWGRMDGTLGALLPCSVSGRTAEPLALMWRRCDPNCPLDQSSLVIRAFKAEEKGGERAQTLTAGSGREQRRSP